MNNQVRKGISTILMMAMVFTILFSASLGQVVQAATYSIPGQIEAESYASQRGWSSNITETCSDTGGGLDVGYTAAGSFLTYPVDVQTAGIYKVIFRVAGIATTANMFSLRDANNNKLCTLKGPGNFGSTGWQSWVNETTYVSLAQGTQNLVLYCEASGFNINWISFSSQTIVADPTVNLAPGTYAKPLTVSLLNQIPDAQIYYTTDGTTPTISSTLYTSAISVSEPTTITAIGVRSGMENSNVVSFNYIFDSNAKTAAPVASKASGSYSGTQSVTLSSATAGAKIYYTTDGSIPTSASSLYSSAISIASNKTLNAFATSTYLNDSDVSSYNYLITAAAPAASPVNKATIGNNSKITLSSTITDGSIYYTTDGTVPTTASALYTTPIIVTPSIVNNNTVTIVAIAAGTNVLTSKPATFVYTYDTNFVILTDEASIPTVVSEMTLSEKINLLGGQSYKPLAGAAGSTQAFPRLGIPATSLSDGPSGLRITALPSGFKDANGNQTTRYATQWPAGTARASAWNTDLDLQYSTAWGAEEYYFGNDLALCPGMNIQRFPRNGRNFEYYSEDPFLTGKTAAAEIKGFQSAGVGMTIKHFFANNQEAGRINLPTQISQRAQREIYLRGFEIAIKEAQPWAIMTSYNQVNGVSTAENFDLLTTIMRGEWGFKGIAMTDWGGQGNASYWPAQTGNNVHSSLVKAGEDLSEGSGNANNVLAGYKAGFITMEDIDKCVTRILQYVIKTPAFHGKALSTEPNIYAASNLELGINTAIEGMTLLKNNYVNNQPALPVKSGDIALLGNATSSLILGGTGSGACNVDPTKVIQIPAALRAIYTGGNVVDGTTLGYTQVSNEMAPTVDQLTTLVSTSSSVIYTIKRTSGEGLDTARSKGAYLLTDAENNLITNTSNVCRAAGKPFIVVLNMGAPIKFESWKDKADAILLAWEPGLAAGQPIARILTGAANPSGKLSSTFPIDVTGYYNGDTTKPYSPAEDNFGPTTGVQYKEGIFVGYRYYDTFNVPVSYEFGFGKSYSTFAYSNMQLSSTTFNSIDSKLNVSVDVKNISTVPGKEIVQLYVGAPGISMQKPVKELKGFVKTEVLAENESQTMNFTLDSKLLASYDTARSSWVVEPGKYVVYGAASSKDIRQVSTFTVPNEIIVEVVNDVLKPTATFTEFQSPISASTPVITGYVSEFVSTNTGSAPILPPTVQAIFSDGTTPAVNVTWDTIDPLSYTAAGTFTVKGTVEGSTVKAVANVTVILAEADKSALAQRRCPGAD